MTNHAAEIAITVGYVFENGAFAYAEPEPQPEPQPEP
jgi:hypothetical protein